MRQGPASINQLLRDHGVVPRKRLGQHFLADPNIIAKMVATAQVGPGDNVLEVGAGTGSLTVALADTGAHVVSYEVDSGLRSILHHVVGNRPNVELRFEDAVGALPSALGSGRWKMVANLPYNIGTRLLLTLLRDPRHVQEFTVMVQQEVADRLIAGQGSRSYGLPSVVVGLTADARRAFTVPPQVFVPAPRVSSAVVVAHRRRSHEHLDDILELAARAFGHRRKMLRSSIDPAVLLRAGIDPHARPEDLSPQQFVDIWEASHG
jgi:16S rRNA (adenine1518-N6/adenine1519-N6)-dimethyltransferase